MDQEFVFKDRKEFREWLRKYGETSGGIWVVFAKTKTLQTLSAEEALEEALCFGWIDGLLSSIDRDRYKKYFSKRRKRSPWSEKNKNLVEKLIREEKMTDAGRLAVEEAKRNGEWKKVKDRSISIVQKAEFESKIEDKWLAYHHYCKMPQSAQKLFIGFYFEVKKEETKQKRLEKIIGLLEQGKKLM